jgi:hypothetical protein
LISPAPNSSRNSSQRSSHITSSGGATDAGPRKTARNPASTSRVSQPKPYQTCPTLTIDRYSAHSTSHSAIQPGSGSRSATPTSAAADSAMPAQQHPAKNRSDQCRWNTLGDRRNVVRARNRGTGVSPAVPMSGRNCRSAATKAIR